MSDIENVKKLRQATGAGFKDCNLAIKESGGDIDKAIRGQCSFIYFPVFLESVRELLNDTQWHWNLSIY